VAYWMRLYSSKGMNAGDSVTAPFQNPSERIAFRDSSPIVHK
jgi:hypothetical protein